MFFLKKPSGPFQGLDFSQNSSQANETAGLNELKLIKFPIQAQKKYESICAGGKHRRITVYETWSKSKKNRILSFPFQNSMVQIYEKHLTSKVNSY
jgi:hypothetical protein